MSSDLFLNNKKYISAKEASSLTGYSRDYIGQLARGNKIDSKKIRGVWYVEEKSILHYNDFSIELGTPVKSESVLEKFAPVLENIDKKILDQNPVSPILPTPPLTPLLIYLPPKTLWPEIKKTPLKTTLSPNKKLLLATFGFLLSIGVFSVIDINSSNKQFNGSDLTADVLNGIPSYIAKLSDNIINPLSDFFYHYIYGPEVDYTNVAVIKHSTKSIPVPEVTTVITPEPIVKTKTESPKIITIRGPVGPTGPSGLRGLTGSQGPQGPKGDTGIQTYNSTNFSQPAYIPVSPAPIGIIQPNPITNYSGGSLFSATDLSSRNFNTNVANIANLTVSESSTLKGGLSVTGNSSFTGDLNVTGTITGNFTIPGGGGDMVIASIQTITGAKTFNEAKLFLRNVADTFNGSFTNTNTGDRVYTLPDVSGTVALTTDITGINSGTNTGDNAVNSNYSNDYRTANFVAGTDYLTPTGSATGLTSFPTLNQNTTGNALTATTSTNLAGGLGGQIPYQSAAGTTAMLANGGAGQVLQSNGTTLAPSWITLSGGGDMSLASTQTVTGVKTFLDTTLLLRNVANTFNGSFTNTNTADRVYTLPDSSGVVVLNPMTTGGDIIYADTFGTPTRLANGTAGYVLQSNGTTLAPTWVPVASSGANTSLSNLASVAINTDLIGAVTGGMGIRGGTAANDDLILEGTTNATRTSSYIIMQPNGGNVGIGMTNPVAMLSVKSTGTTDLLNLIETGGTEVFTVLESGNVGVGTTNPTYKMEIKSGTAGFAFDAVNQNWGTLFGTGGNFGIYAETPGSVTGGAMQMGGSARGDTQRNAIQFLSNNVERMRIDGNFTGHTIGFVGIGKTNPGTALDVVGTVTATSFSGAGTGLTGTAASLTAGLATNLAGGLGGQIPYQSALGTTAMLANGSAGQVLQSNGTTLAPTWITLPGGGDMLLASTQTVTGAKTFLDTTLLLRNVANTFNGSFTNTNTANRVYTLPNTSGTVALSSDITGINSGTNTGDNAVNSNYASDYRLANFIAGTNYLAPNGSAALLTSFPTLNQNTTGNAATATNLTGLTASISNLNTLTGALGTAAFTASTVYAPALGIDDNYVTDAEKVVIGNTSGANTGDNAVNSNYSSDYRAANFIAGTNYLAPYGSTTANYFLAAPSGSAGTPSFRGITILDLPVMTASVGGAVPTPPNNTTTFLRGDGTFATPSGGGDMLLASVQTNSGAKTFLDTTLLLRNVANTFNGSFTNTNTADRVYTLPNASGTVALTTDITGTNSGTNTGDNAANSNYASDYRLANFVAGTNYLAPNGSAALLTSFPTLNQSTTGNALTATTATTATNLAGGFGGSIPYQSAAGTTAMLANGGAGQVLQSNGTTLAPTWITLPGGGDMLLASVQTVTGAKTFNSSKLILAGSISGTTELNSNSTAGTSVITLPSGTHTLLATDGSGASLTRIASGLTAGAISGQGSLATLSAAPAGTLTGATLASGVTASSLTSFGNSPSLVTPSLGVATASSINKVTITAPATSAILTLGDGTTLSTGTASVAFNANAIQFAGGTITSTFPTGTHTLLATDGSAALLTSFPTLNQSTTGNALTATTATNLVGGLGGQIPYQSAAGITAMLANGTAGYVLQSNGTTLAPTWAPVASSGANTSLSNLSAVAINTDLIGAVAGGMGIRGGSAANDDLILEGTTNATRTSSYIIMQPNGGNVGIGTTSPTTKLQIASGQLLVGPNLVAGYPTTIGIVSTHATDAYFGAALTSGETSFLEAYSGQAGLDAYKYGAGGGGIPLNIGGFNGGGNTTNLRFWTSGSERMDITSTGNVGIGTTVPGAKLVVSGAVNTSFVPASWTQNFILDNAATSSQNVTEYRVAGTARGAIRVDSGGDIIVSGTGTGATYLSYDGGTSGVYFGNGAQGTNANVSAAGVFTGTNFSGPGTGLTGIPAAGVTGTAWTQSSLTNLNQLTNGPGFITSAGTATNFSGSLAGDVTGTQGATVVGDNSHAHDGTTISGLAVADFTSPNLSLWTNNLGWITSSGSITGTAGGLTGTPNITVGTITSGLINGQTISSAANFTGSVTLAGGNLILGANTLTTSNTGVVTNLNADRLDSLHSTDFSRSLGSSTFTSSTTTAAFIADLTSKGAFNFTSSSIKGSWDYAGNNDISDTGYGAFELAGTAIQTWSDGTNKTVLAIRPTTGAGGGQILVYNDQGVGYSPGWRQIWTDTTDGSGTGLDADLVDGLSSASFYLASNPSGYITSAGTATNFSGSLAGDVTGTQGATVVGDNSHLHDGSTISGLAVADFTSPNLSLWTNNLGWITSSGSITGTSGGLTGTPNITVGTITSGLINGQTISSAANFTGTLTTAGTVVINAATAATILTSTTGTNAVYHALINTGGAYYFGVDNSTATVFGSGAYNMVLYTPGGLAMKINPTNSQITIPQPATFSSTITSGLINGQTISSAANFTGTINAASTITAPTFSGALSGNATSANTLTVISANASINLNTMGLGRAYTYSSAGDWVNGPSGISYGSVYNLGGSNSSILSLQIAADVNHNSTLSTKQLWFRMGNNLGFQNDWKEILHSGNYNNYSPTLTGTGASGNWAINSAGLYGSPNITVGTITSGLINGQTISSAANFTGTVTLGGNLVLGANTLTTSNTTVISNLNADLLDGQQGSYYDQRVYTSANNYLGGYYVSGGTEKPNNAVFGPGKLKVAMLSGGNLGFGGSWNDVLWMSTYSGGDVKSSYAIVGDKYSDNLYFSRQDFDSATWGTGYKLLHSGNFNSYAPTLTGGGASGNWAINSAGLYGSPNITTGTITSGLINGQTISSAANFTGTLNVATELTVGGSSGAARITTNQMYCNNASACYFNWNGTGVTNIGNSGGGTVNLGNGSATVTGGTYNGQTISSAANFTGTVAAATSVTAPSFTVSGNGQFMAGNVAANMKLKAGAGGATGITGYDSANVWRWQLYGDGSSYGFLNGNWAGWDMQKTIGGALVLNGSQTVFTSATAVGSYPTFNQNTTGTAATVTTAAQPAITSVGTLTSITTSGPIYRTVAGAGYLNGQYAGAESTLTSGAIYSIGGSYVPGTTNLGNMYGIGFGYSGNAGIGATGVPASHWGMYTASGGVSKIFLDADVGSIYINGTYYGAGTGLTGTAAGLTAGAANSLVANSIAGGWNNASDSEYPVVWNSGNAIYSNTTVLENPAQGLIRLAKGAYDGQLIFGTTGSAWNSGIRQFDSAAAEMRIWEENNNGKIFITVGNDQSGLSPARPTTGLMVGSNGYVGIGDYSTTMPAYKFTVKGTPGDWTAGINQDGASGYGLLAYGSTYALYGSGPIYGTTSITAGSSFNGPGTGLTGTAASLTAGLASNLTGTPNISVGTIQTSGTVTVGSGGTGKITVTTWDPPYTIGGVTYATYGSGMIGVKEEVTGIANVSEPVEKVGYKQVIDFKTLTEGSDLWLFSRAVDVTQHLNKMSVLLTPMGNARVWYHIDKDNYTLTIYSTKQTEVSYRLTAPRFDTNEWTNYNNDEGVSGLVPPDQNFPTLVIGDPSAIDALYQGFDFDINLLFEKLVAWFADSANGITKMFVGEINTDISNSNTSNTNNLCVKKSNGTNICITGDELDALLLNSQNSSLGSGSGSVSDVPTTPTFQSISITTPPTKLSYTQGDTLDITDLIVTGTYSDNTTKAENITVDNISGFDSSIITPTQTLTITVGDKTTTFTVEIKELIQP